MASEPQDQSRRVFFGRLTTYAVGAAIIGGLAPNIASAQAKVAQSAVAYQEKPKGTQRCDGCSLFQAPNACKVVDGTVSPQGWCSLFAAKA
jgi:High potential iron-sulfur protein